MHTEKIKIFDEYAQTQGFKSWEDLKLTQDLDLMSSEEFDVHVFTACDLVQKVQQERIAENSKVEHAIIIFGDQYPESKKAFENEDKDEVYAVDKSSVISENNLIK